jgi:hypothetical protein
MKAEIQTHKLPNKAEAVTLLKRLRAAATLLRQHRVMVHKLHKAATKVLHKVPEIKVHQQNPA